MSLNEPMIIAQQLDEWPGSAVAVFLNQNGGISRIVDPRVPVPANAIDKETWEELREALE